MFINAVLVSLLGYFYFLFSIPIRFIAGNGAFFFLSGFLPQP